jgi:hypothetical protein
MKMNLLVATLVLSATTAFAAPATKARTISSSNTTTNAKPLFVAAPTDRRAFIGVNVVALAKSVGNVSADFFVNNRVSANLLFQSSSEKEWQKKSRQNLPTDRTAYGIGSTFWVKENEAKTNLLGTFYLAFGSKKDAIEVETMSGFGLKASVLHRFTPDLAFEGGLAGNTLDNGSLKGDLYAGVGFLF